MAERMSDNAVRARLRDAQNEPDDDEVVAPRAKRRTPELLLGLLLVVGGALGGLLMFQRGNSLVTVVGAARDLPRGTVITRTDVVAVEVGTLPAAAVIAADAAGSILGKRLLVDVPAGVPIAGHTVTDQQLLTSSQALIPLALEALAVPSGLSRGDFVRVIISFPNRGVDAPPPEILGETMEVFDVTTTDDFGDDVLVTVRATADLAVDIARADRIQVMKVPGR